MIIALMRNRTGVPNNPLDEVAIACFCV